MKYLTLGQHRRLQDKEYFETIKKHSLEVLSLINTLEIHKGKKITIEEAHSIILMANNILTQPDIKKPLNIYIECFKSEIN